MCIEIKPEDVLIEYYLTKKQRGQILRTPKGCRISHKSTGVVVLSEKGRSQHHNRALAFTLLELVLEGVFSD